MSTTATVPAVYVAPSGNQLTLMHDMPELTRDVIFTPYQELLGGGPLTLGRLGPSYELTIRVTRKRGEELVVITDDPFRRTELDLLFITADGLEYQEEHYVLAPDQTPPDDSQVKVWRKPRDIFETREGRLVLVSMTDDDLPPEYRLYEDKSPLLQPTEVLMAGKLQHGTTYLVVRDGSTVSHLTLFDSGTFFRPKLRGAKLYARKLSDYRITEFRDGTASVVKS